MSIPLRCRLLACAVLLSPAVATADDPPTAEDRQEQAREFHRRAQERTGILVPLYLYPGDVDRNPDYQRLMDLRRRFETVPMWVIVNPASGPGRRVDPNYTRAIDRLRGAGCVVLGYVTTSYGERSREEVRAEVERWMTFYPRIHGLFFDEMNNEDTDADAAYQAALTRDAHDAGLWPVVANPGTDTPRRYFDADAADVFVVHEGSDWPDEADLDALYADSPAFNRGVLVHSQAEFDADALRSTRDHARWIYVTEAPYRPGDPGAANPWDRVSRHLEDLCEALDRRPGARPNPARGAGPTEK